VIVAVPAVPPVATPVPDTTPAVAVLLLVHTPPVDASVKVVVVPGHIDKFPAIAAGAGLTVIVYVVVHPAGVV